MAASASLQKLIQIPICRGLTEREAASILEIAEEAQAKAGQPIFNEGDPGDGLYVVLEGGVEVLKKDRTGKSQSLARLGDGSVIGEMSLINNNAARSASAVVTNDVRLLKVPSARFNKLLAGDNVAALKIIHNLAQVMSRRLLLMDEKLVELLDKGKRREELADFQKILTNWAF